MPMSSTLSLAAGLWRTQIRTDRADVHKGGEGEDPEVRGIDYVASIELKLGSDTLQSEYGVKQWTCQETIS